MIPATQAMGGQLIERRLSNGLRVVLLSQPGATTVAVHTWLDTGSASEKPHATGVAHLLEHLMFKGTKTRPAGRLDAFLESHGASANAATWMDWTVFHQVVLPEQVTEVLAFEADRLVGLAWHEAEFQAELEVVRNERREQVDDQPDGRSSELLYALAYGQAPYGHPTIGHAADLRAMKMRTVQAHYRAHYAPNRATIVLVGAVSPSMLDTVERAYGHLKPSAGAPKPARVALPQLSGQRATVMTEGEVDRVHIGWRTVSVEHADHAPLTVLVEILANADSTRLTDGLTRQGKLASSVSMEQTMTRREGMAELQIEALPGIDAAKVADAVDALITRLLDSQPVTTEEVEAAQRRLLLRHYETLATADGCAELLGLFAVIGGGAQQAERWMKSVEAVTAQDVQRTAKRWLTRQHQVTVLARARKRVQMQGRR